MSFSQSWLQDSSSIKKIFALVTVFNKNSEQEEQLFLSNTLYGITAAGIYFTPCLGGNLNFTERVQITSGAVNIDNGTLELLNYSGELDSWLDSSSYVWYNRSIKIYVGDPNWVTTSVANFEATFKLVFKGIVEDIDGTDQNRLGLKLRSVLAKLNASISELTLEGEGGASTVEDLSQKFAPIILGEVFNISPQLTVPADLKYVMHKAPGSLGTYRKIKGIIEIRDNGIPLYTVNKSTLDGWYTGAPGTLSESTGSVTLGAQPAGNITCSVQGDNRSIDLTNGDVLDHSTSYSDNVISIIALILTQYGTSTARLNASEIDWTSFLHVSTLLGTNSSVGVFITSRDNILPVLQTLAESAGIQIVASATGVVKIVKLGAYAGPVIINTVTPDDIVANSFSVSSRPDVIAAVKLGYCKTWTKQADLLASAIPDEHKKLFDDAYEYVNVQDANVGSVYRVPLDVDPLDTYLINEVQALARASEILNYFKIQKTVYKFKGTPNLMQLVLGQFITLTHPRFGFSTGKSVQVISITYNYSDFTVDIEVIS